MQNLLNPVVTSPERTPPADDAADDEATTVTGLHLPISRIKKIIKLDPEHISSTDSANYVLGIATELFIKQLTLDSSIITKNKGRKKITYDDLHKVVSSADIYSFMKDIVPKRAAIGELMTKGIIRLRPDDDVRMRAGLEKFGYVDEGEGPGDQIAEDEDAAGNASGEAGGAVSTTAAIAVDDAGSETVDEADALDTQA